MRLTIIALIMTFSTLLPGEDGLAHLASISPVPLTDQVPVQVVFQDLSGFVISVEPRFMTHADLVKFLNYWGEDVRLDNRDPSHVWLEIAQFWVSLSQPRPIYVTLYPSA